MSRPELVLDVGVVLAALVDIVDQQADGGARGHLLAGLVGKHARQQAHRIGLAALGGEARLARPALVEEHLNVLCRQRDAGRAAIDNAADRWAVAFTPGGDPKQMAKRVVRHRADVRFCGAKKLITDAPRGRQRALHRSVAVWCGYFAFAIAKT